MINLNVFTINQLRNTLIILNEFSNNGVIDILQIQKELDNRISTFIKKNTNETKQLLEGNRVKKVKIRMCPSCKKGKMSYVKNPEGLMILGCSVCRYSEIMEDKNVN